MADARDLKSLVRKDMRVRLPPPAFQKGKNMAKLILDGLTADQAKHLADWFEGQGEQDCAFWLENQGVKSPLTDVCRQGGCFETIGDDTVLHCYTPRD